MEELALEETYEIGSHSGLFRYGEYSSDRSSQIYSGKRSQTIGRFPVNK